ncbi:MAG: InlB B-repeat-containing protein [Bacteroidales bacterium]|nr:InlB B-repeat-containing protein [Bacteroidales bacterium]
MNKKVYQNKLRQMMLKCFALVLFLTAGVTFSSLMAQNQSAVANRTIFKQVSATRVSVTGQMPQAAQVTVTQVQRSAVQGKQVKGAYDITIQNGNKVWQPQAGQPVMVTIADPNFVDGEYMDVYHEGANGNEFVATVAAENGKITFPARSFSVYIVTETGAGARLKVNFHQIGGGVTTILVKAKDTLDANMYKTVLYDPGVGQLGDTVQFRGWFTDSTYTVANADDGMSIAEVRDFVKPSLVNIHDGDSIDLWPLLYKTYKVTYYDENGTIISSKEVLYLVSEDNTYHSCLISEAYVPTSSEQNFLGWLVQEGGSNIQGHTSGKVYPNDTTILIKGNVKMRADVPYGHWLIFDENGKGATYIAPQFVENGQVTTEPTIEMARFGYHFDGWYTGEPATQYGDPTGSAFVFGQPITENTTVYAKWSENETANYTIIIWKQNVHDAKNATDANKTYDFAESVSLTGNVGDEINAVSSTGTGNNAYAIVNGTAKQYEGFHLRTYDENVTIVTEGTSVVNVYYDRNLVTLTFQYRQNNSWQTQTTMTGLYGSTLESNGYEWPTNRWWYDTTTTQYGQYVGAGTRTTFLDAFILSDGSSSQTFYGFTGSGNNTIHFMKQNDAGGYTEANTVTSSGGTFYISDKYNGYYAAQYSTNGTDWTDLGEKDPTTGYYGSISSTANMYVRYNRLTYSILYEDGVYVNGGTGAPISNAPDQGTLLVVNGVPFESDITSYDKGGTNYYEPTYTGYVFEGWYMDDQCTQAYTFTNMPEGITVYAKWRQVQYRIFLHPNAVDPETNQVDSTLDWGTDDQAMTFRVDLGKKVSIPTGLRDDYTLMGWYKDEACTQVFNADVTPLSDAVVTTLYDQTDYTDLMDKWGNIITDSIDPSTHEVIDPWNSDAIGYNGEARFWITKKLDLYAKWRSKLEGAKGIHINYVFIDEQGTDTILVHTEEDLFNDNVSTFSIPAPTSFNGMPNPQDSVFQYWVIQHWSDDEGDFIDSEETVYPGSPFTISKADAYKETNPDYDPDTNATVDQFIYTIQIRAEYVPVEKETPTFIVWFTNDGDSSIVRKDTNLQINEAVSIPIPDARPGYKFLGWYKLNVSTPEPPKTVDTIAPNFLYFNSTDSLFYADAAFQTQADSVAADEANPYDYLYAIWESAGYTVRFNKVADGASGTMPEQDFDFDVKYELSANAFTYAEHCFLGWDINAAAATVVHQDKDSVINLTNVSGDTVDLYAVWQEKVTPEFDLEDAYCMGAEVTLPTTSDNGVAGTWNPETVNTSVATTAPVTYTFTPTDTCHAVYTIAITINPTYDVADSHTMCQGDTYTWQGHTFGSEAGTFTETETLKTVNDCDSVVTMTVTVNPLPTVTVSDTAACEGFSATLEAVATNVSYQWKNANGNIPGATSATYSTDVEGDYTVVVTDLTTGCVNQTTASVTINPNPALTLVLTDQTCTAKGKIAVTTSETTPYYNYYLNNQPKAQTNALTFTHEDLTAGTYTVKVIDGNKCYVDSTVVLHFDQTEISFDPLSLIACNKYSFDTIPVGAPDTVMYVWNAPVCSATTLVDSLYQTSWATTPQGSIKGRLVNSGTTPATATYTVTPILGDCVLPDVTVSVTVTAQILPEVVLSLNATSPVCADKDTVVATATVANSYATQDYSVNWTWQGEVTAETVTVGTTNLSHVIDIPQVTDSTSYTLKLSYTDGICTAATSTEVVVIPLPTLDITNKTQTITFGESIADVEITNTHSNLAITPSTMPTGFTYDAENQIISATMPPAGTYEFAVEAGGNMAPYCDTLRDTIRIVVNPKPLTIEISCEKMYDGTPFVVTYDNEDCVTVDGLVDGDALTAGTATTYYNNAASYKVGHYTYTPASGLSFAAIEDGDVLVDPAFASTYGLENYDVTYDIALDITLRPITITAHDSTKMYDGVALTDTIYTISGSGLAENDEIASIAQSGSQFCVGTADHTISNALIIKTDDNNENVTDQYDITYVDGTLTVTDYTEFECPDDLTIELNFGQCDTVFEPEIPTIEDIAEGMYTITNNLDELNPLDTGVHVITWMLTDTCHNIMATCDQTVTVVFRECPVAVDADNNTYQSVRIGCDCWTQTNLVSETYGSKVGGGAIEDVMTYNATPYFDDEAANEQTYGHLYTWNAAIKDGADNGYGHIQGICPDGWYLPTKEKYEGLAAYGPEALRADILWADGGGTNTTGFTGLPGGRYVGNILLYRDMTIMDYYWATTTDDAGVASAVEVELTMNCLRVKNVLNTNPNGYSIRCIKERVPETEGTETTEP